MKNLILKILKNTWGLLIFALISGFAYFSVVYRFVLMHTEVGGHLLGMFLLPLIVCGAALVLVKLIKQCLLDEREGTAVTIFLLHIFFIIIAAITAAVILFV